MFFIQIWKEMKKFYNQIVKTRNVLFTQLTNCNVLLEKSQMSSTNIFHKEIIEKCFIIITAYRRL